MNARRRPEQRERRSPADQRGGEGAGRYARGASSGNVVPAGSCITTSLLLDDRIVSSLGAAARVVNHAQANQAARGRATANVDPPLLPHSSERSPPMRSTSSRQM